MMPVFLTTLGLLKVSRRETCSMCVLANWAFSWGSFKPTSVRLSLESVAKIRVFPFLCHWWSTGRGDTGESGFSDISFSLSRSQRVTFQPRRQDLAFTVTPKYTTTYAHALRAKCITLSAHAREGYSSLLSSAFARLTVFALQ